MVEGRGREGGGRGSGQLSSIHPFLSLQPYMPGIRSNKSLWLTPNERVTLVDSLSATPTASDCGQLAAILLTLLPFQSEVRGSTTRVTVTLCWEGLMYEQTMVC